MFVMATNNASTSHFRTFTEFLTYVRANPGKISWGSSGIAGPQHLGGMQFVKIAGVDMVHVPYRGNGPMLQALLANEVQLTFDTPTLSFPHIQDGKLTALAVTGNRRMPKLPDVPTVREAAARLLDRHLDFRDRSEGNPRTCPGLAEQGNRRGTRRQESSRPADRLRARSDRKA